MKKILLMMAAAAMFLTACDKESKPGQGGNEPVLPLEATVEVGEIPALTHGQPADLTATVTTTEKLSEVAFAGAVQEGETFKLVGENQLGAIDGDKVTVQFFADTKEMTHIAVTVKAGNKTKTVYVPSGEVTGNFNGDVWIEEAAKMEADGLVKNHQNSPDLFPVDKTGDGSDAPSFFSMHGVKIDGKIKHILSLSEARPLDGKNLSMILANVYKSTEKDILLSSQRGFVVCDIPTTTAGSIGRQCDAYEVDGHSIKKACEQGGKFKIRLVRGAWGGADRYNPEEFNAVHGLFSKIEKAETQLEKMKAFWQLGEIQRKLDNATLGETNEPTSFGGSNMMRRFLYAGHKFDHDNTSRVMKETFRAGDYFLIRSERKQGEETVYYYGIIYVRQLPDDTGMIITDPTTQKECLDAAKVPELFNKPAFFSIKTQCEIQ